MSTSKNYPTPEQFLIELPLYEVITYADEDLEFGRKLRYFGDTLDSYCPHCNTHSIFERYWQNSNEFYYEADSWVESGFFSIDFKCTRNNDHKLHFIFHASGKTIQKIGQMPSIADLNHFDVKKYSKVLDEKYFQEFTKAIGLVSHGIGVGSFVYLRRIFEFLIEESHTIAKVQDGWDEDLYLKSRMNEKIKLLQSELPEFLVENSAIYSILSKGIHELNEKECLAAFPAMKVGIEIILDEKLEQLNRAKKLAEAKKSITALNSAVKT